MGKKIQIVIPGDLLSLIVALVQAGVELIGDHTIEQLEALAAAQEARSDDLQKRQEEG